MGSPEKGALVQKPQCGTTRNGPQTGPSLETLTGLPCPGCSVTAGKKYIRFGLNGSIIGAQKPTK